MAEPTPNLAEQISNPTATTTALNFRPPSSSSSSSSSSSPEASDFKSSGTKWMSGEWHVTHSSLPMWKSNRNVTITYTLIPEQADTFDNLVKYQPLTSDKYKTVAGIEKPDPKIEAAWNWRGKGWLMIASSHWELLGWGEDDGGWMVTFFQKTLFTPAGIDILARNKVGVSPETLERIRERIKSVNDSAFAQLAIDMFEVKRDL